MTFGLANLVNRIDRANVDSIANFNGNGAGHNHIKVLNGQSGSVLNFSQLQNLVNEIDTANVDSIANFNGNGAGHNHVKVLNGQRGSVLNFSQLQNLINIRDFQNQGHVTFNDSPGHNIDHLTNRGTIKYGNLLI